MLIIPFILFVFVVESASKLTAGVKMGVEKVIGVVTDLPSIISNFVSQFFSNM